MTFAIVSPGSPSFRQVTDISNPNKAEYAKRWGIPLELPHYADERALKDKGWGRIDFMQEYLRKYDWILYMGADTIFINFRIDARAWCIEHYDLLLAFDQNGIQTDVMWMQNTPAMHAVLDETRARRALDFDKSGLAGSDQGAFATVLSGREKYENAMDSVLLKKKLRLAKISKVVNRYQEDILPGDFIYHAAGCDKYTPPAMKKSRQLRQHLSMIIR